MTAFHPKPDIKLELLNRSANDPKRTYKIPVWWTMLFSAFAYELQLAGQHDAPIIADLDLLLDDTILWD